MKTRMLFYGICIVTALWGIIFSGCDGEPDLGGLETPVTLTDTQETQVIQIAMATEEAAERLAKDETFKTDLRWMAIVWHDSEFSAFYSLDYDWANDINLGNVPEEALWYPAVIINFGEPAVWQVTAAVDLELGKAVYVMGNPVRRGPEPELEISPAPIHDVKVNIAESYPPQVFLYIKGGLRDSCTAFHDIQIVRTGNMIDIELNVERPREAVCAQVYEFFERNEGLGSDFVSGETYTIKVNDYTTSFVMP